MTVVQLVAPTQDAPGFREGLAAGRSALAAQRGVLGRVGRWLDARLQPQRFLPMVGAVGGAAVAAGLAFGMVMSAPEPQPRDMADFIFLGDQCQGTAEAIRVSSDGNARLWLPATDDDMSSAAYALAGAEAGATVAVSLTLDPSTGDVICRTAYAMNVTGDWVPLDPEAFPYGRADQTDSGQISGSATNHPRHHRHR